MPTLAELRSSKGTVLLAVLALLALLAALAALGYALWGAPRVPASRPVAGRSR